MAAAFVHVRMPATGRVELLHPMTAEALGLEVVDPAAEVEAPHAADDDDDDDEQTSEHVAPQRRSATE